MAYKLLITVLSLAVAGGAIPINDLLERASQHSDKLHQLSSSLAQQLDSQFPPMGRAIMPRPSMCHTASLQTPNDKEQALQASESDLLSLARSLLQAWVNPLVLLSTSADSLPHPAQSSISNKVQELQEHSRNLGDGLDILSSKMDPAAQVLSHLPYRGDNEVGQDRLARLINFSFMLSCFRRDSHKIDSFLKVLRCRAARLHPHLC